MLRMRNIFQAAIAQLGERQTEDLKAPRSIRGGGISFFQAHKILFTTYSLPMQHKLCTNLW